MTNEEIIVELLKFVRVHDDRLEVSDALDRWTPLAVWHSQNKPFSTYLLNSANSAEQTEQLQEYFYYTFYVLGRFNLSPVKESPPSPESPLRIIPLNNRPKVTDEVIQKKSLPNGDLIVEQDTIRFITKPGNYITTTEKITTDNIVAKIFNGLPNNCLDKVDDNTWYWSNSTQLGFDFQNRYIRFYLHPYPKQAQAVTHFLIERLDSYNIPFKIKYLGSDIVTNRCDRIVLYVPQQQFVIASWTIMHVYNVCKAYLQDQLPLFVKHLLPGIGFAEDPSEVPDDSFGQSRCTWIAYAVIQWADNLPAGTSASPPVAKLIDTIKRNQKVKNLNNIHLNPDSFYPYDFEIFERTIPLKSKPKKVSFWLQGAVDTANFLCREVACVTPRQYIWIGVRDEGDLVPYRPLENDWERGFIGPALFLHMLEKYVDEPLYKYILERTVPNLRDELSESDSSIRDTLLTVYNYRKRHSLLSTLYKVRAFFANCSFLRCICKDKPSNSDRLEANAKGTGPYCIKYAQLLKILIENNQKPHWRSKELYDTLKEVHIKSRAFLTNVNGWDDLTPGMNGLALLGFSYLMAHDPLLPPIPRGKLEKGC